MSHSRKEPFGRSGIHAKDFCRTLKPTFGGQTRDLLQGIAGGQSSQGGSSKRSDRDSPETEVTQDGVQGCLDRKGKFRKNHISPRSRRNRLSKAPAVVRLPRNAPVIVGGHDTGPLIHSKNGLWLAIPMPAADKSLRGGRITLGEWQRRTGLRLRFIYRRRGPSLLVAEERLNTKGRAFGRLSRPHKGHGPASPSRSKTGRGLVTAPIFLLVPQVKLPKRLDLARDAERAHDAVPGVIVANWVDR